ncbi:MAG: TlpA family protein disulfide reductase [Anaerolineae bacterium]|nr:TlpA family protein disulfide reductase [Anaerolineae bacterium]
MSDTQPEVNPPRQKINPVILLFLIFPVMGFIVGLSMARERAGTAVTPMPVVAGYTPERGLIGNLAPDLSLKTPNGDTVQLSSLRGQWVFLNFWATWCPPCQQEMPTFQQLLNGEFGAVQGKLTVLAVDQLESADKVTAFLNERKLSIPTVIDSDATATRLYGVVQLPITFVIDPKGIVRYEQLGEMTPELLKAYLKEIL